MLSQRAVCTPSFHVHLYTAANAPQLQTNKPTGATFTLYHGTNVAGANKIKEGGPKLLTGGPYHDFAKGKNTAFYMTPSKALAEEFAKERASTSGETKAATVSWTFTRSKAKVYEFSDVAKWNDVRGLICISI